jgi:hypothetical protein
MTVGELHVEVVLFLTVERRLLEPSPAKKAETTVSPQATAQLQSGTGMLYMVSVDPNEEPLYIAPWINPWLPYRLFSHTAYILSFVKGRIASETPLDKTFGNPLAVVHDPLDVVE